MVLDDKVTKIYKIPRTKFIFNTKRPTHHNSPAGMFAQFAAFEHRCYRRRRVAGPLHHSATVQMAGQFDMISCGCLSQLDARFNR